MVPSVLHAMMASLVSSASRGRSESSSRPVASIASPLVRSVLTYYTPLSGLPRLRVLERNPGARFTPGWAAGGHPSFRRHSDTGGIVGQLSDTGTVVGRHSDTNLVVGRQFSARRRKHGDISPENGPCVRITPENDSKVERRPKMAQRPRPDPVRERTARASQPPRAVHIRCHRR